MDNIIYKQGNLLDVQSGVILHGCNAQGVIVKTLERVHDVFYYDESSLTSVRWLLDRFSGNHGNIISAKAGDEAGSIDHRKEAFITRFNGKSVKVHRIVALLHGYDIENKTIDHIDGNPLNNKISNLRLVGQDINSRNRKMPNNNTSGFTGVNLWTDSRGSMFWMARWVENGIRKQKSFSVKKYGYNEAYELACYHRTKGINSLVDHGYTDRHGKRQQIINDCARITK